MTEENEIMIEDDAISLGDISEENQQDIDVEGIIPFIMSKYKKSEDHLYDALRYGVMTRPRSSLFDYNPMSQSLGFQAADATFGY